MQRRPESHRFSAHALRGRSLDDRAGLGLRLGYTVFVADQRRFQPGSHDPCCRNGMDRRRGEALPRDGPWISLTTIWSSFESSSETLVWWP